jgi:hypothetical protein
MVNTCLILQIQSFFFRTIDPKSIPASNNEKSVLPLNESERLKALESYSIMDSLPEQEYDSITQLASYIWDPIALISLEMRVVNGLNQV